MNMNQSLSFRKAHTCRSGESHVVLRLPSQVVVVRIHGCDWTALVTSSQPTDEEGNKRNGMTHAAATVSAAEAATNDERPRAHHHPAWLLGVKAADSSITRCLIFSGDGCTVAARI